jgi:hypothetical protein
MNRRSLIGGMFAVICGFFWPTKAKGNVAGNLKPLTMDEANEIASNIDKEYGHMFRHYGKIVVTGVGIECDRLRELSYGYFIDLLIVPFVLSNKTHRIRSLVPVERGAEKLKDVSRYRSFIKVYFWADQLSASINRQGEDKSPQVIAINKFTGESTVIRKPE